jgi:hypothetical protein
VCAYISEAGACEKRAVVHLLGQFYCARHVLDVQTAEREKPQSAPKAGDARRRVTDPPPIDRASRQSSPTT